MNTVYEGITELLADLQAAGVRLAVATSKAEPTAQRILEHFGIAGHFEVIAGASLDGSRAAKAEVLAHAGPTRTAAPAGSDGGRPRPRRRGAAEHGIAAVVVGGVRRLRLRRTTRRRACRPGGHDGRTA